MTATEKKRVLIMDDSAIILEAVRDALVDVGLDVETAADLAEFERHCAGDIDLILIDVQMPEAFGDDVAMLLRQKRRLQTKIFLLSSLADDELRDRAAEAEIDGYISKRGGIDIVIEHVQRILDAKGVPVS